MTTRSKDKVVAVFRRFFRSNDKIEEQDKKNEADDETKNGNNASLNSPSRRLFGRLHNNHHNHHNHHHRTDAVTPAEAQNVEKPSTSRSNNHAVALFKSRKSSASSSQSAVVVPDKGVRPRRLMKEFAEIQRNQGKVESTFTAELVNDNLFEWHVRLHKIDPDSELAFDMAEHGVPHILLHMIFPDNFPFAPPFMRVISPKIEKGFVMEGGAICMELLTPRGWASAYTVEAVITQFAASIVKGQGRIARKSKSNKDFNMRSAEESFRNLVKTHEKYGWVTPPLAEG